MSLGGKRSKYTKIQKLGEGTYSVVFLCKNSETGDLVAKKDLKLESIEEGIPATALREMSILRIVSSHINIIKMIDVILKEGSISLVFEYLPNSLGLLLKRGSLEKELARSYSFQLLAGLYELHTHSIIHRDIKPDNLLLDEKGILKICDFNLARTVTFPLRAYSPNVVTQWYRAPELLHGARVYELSIDVWAAGCIIGEMTRGAPLFAGDSDMDQLQCIFEALGTPTLDMSPNISALVEVAEGMDEKEPVSMREFLRTDDYFLCDLVCKMLQYDPVQRIPLSSALKHPYFNELQPAVKRKCAPSIFDN